MWFEKNKVSKTTYIVSLDAHFGIDLNEVNELKLEEVVRLMGRDRQEREDGHQIHWQREDEMN